MTPHGPTSPSSFYGLGIAPKLLEILDKNRYKTPTPIQHQSIPIALEGKDVMGIAQTGTGKTLAFGIPLIQRLAQAKGTGLIVLPTRELALQVDETMQRLGRPIGLRTAVLIGGASMHLQQRAIKARPHVFVVTPGRLIDHLNQKSVDLSHVQVLVLDEADRMLDMGFAPQLKRILEVVPKQRQTLLFSATMPKEIINIARSYMQLPVQVEIARAGTVADKVTQELFFVAKDDKSRLMEKILNDYRGSVLVFSRTKHGAKKIMRSVKAMGHTSAEIHANRSLSQRREALEGFKAGKYRVLVATDIAARGIDVTGIELVLNYDLPDNAEDYVHRIGRTGRAGSKGHAISFATPDQRSDVRDIERLMRSALPVSKLPELPERRAVTMSSYDDQDREDRPSRGFQGGYRGRSSGGRSSGGGARRPGGGFPRPPRQGRGGSLPRPRVHF